MKNTSIFIILIINLTSFICAQENPVLEEYVAIGLESNQTLKQKQLDYSISLSKLNEAKGLFFPDLDFNARYTVAKGGRVIEFPVGDMLNPVYSTLNLLTMSDQFPQIENQEFNFYRPREHETKITITQAIFSNALIQNLKIQRELTGVSAVNIDLYKRELSREIRRAYYEHMKAGSLLALSDTAIRLTKEIDRVSRKLYENNKVTIDAVYRAETELAKAEADKKQAAFYLVSTRSYFNFLINRPLGNEIKTTSISPGLYDFNLDDAIVRALAKREEIQILKYYMNVNGYSQKLEKGDALPDLFAVANYGYQGKDYSFTSDDDFVLASLVLSWDIFSGMTRKNRMRQNTLEKEKLESLYTETEEIIKMEVTNSWYALRAANEEMNARQRLIRASEKAYQVINRRFTEGQASLLELIDAKTTLCGARAGYIVSKSDYFIKLNEFTCSTGE